MVRRPNKKDCARHKRRRIHNGIIRAWWGKQQVRSKRAIILEMTPARRALLGDPISEIEEDYYNSPHWNRVKKRYRRNHLYECVKCGYDENLHLHHKTYERVGKELDSDLEYLCESCHNGIHQRSNGEEE